MDVQELFGGHLMGANESLTLSGITGVCGFLPSVSGTIAVSISGTSIVAATAITAGVYCPIPLKTKRGDVVVTLAGGGAGTLFVL